MKRILFFAGIIACSMSASAQIQQNTYEVSVFRQNRPAKINEAKIASVLKNVKETLPGWSVETDKATGYFKDMYGPGIVISGSDVNEWAANVIEEKLSSLDVTAAEWQPISKMSNPKAFHANYVQSFAGHKVTFSKLSIRFTRDGRLVRIQMRNYGSPANITPSLSKTDAVTAAIKDLSAVTISSTEVNDSWEWFPIPVADGYLLHPAWHFLIKGNTQNNTPLQLSGYVDATNGTILYRVNEIKDAFDITVKGNVYKDGTSSPATLQPLSDLALTIGGNTYYTDTAGYYNNVALGLPITTNVSLSGRWSVVKDVPTATTPSFNTSVSVLGSLYTFPTTAPATSRHINAYYHVNRIHDFMKMQYPTFTDMDIALPTNVDLTSGTCNAFYNGSSINFYAAGGGCVSFAQIGSVVYHEYGHGISDKYYTNVNGTTITNGALNEGNSDVWAMCVTHSPIVGENAYTTGGYIRRYDKTVYVYPKDIIGESHNDGQIIAGAWWDVGVNLGSVDSMANLFTSCYNEAPDGPDGTEGDVYHGVLIAALLEDDNDANINNGTPHFRQIVSAFAKHGIYLLYGATLAHKELDDQPDGVDIPVTATLSIANSFFFSNLKLFYKLRGTTKWDTLTMVNTSDSTYTATIPALSKGNIIDYYLAITDTLNYTDAYYPATYTPGLSSLQTSIPYQFGVGLTPTYTNTFEDSTDVKGWHIGNNVGDDATGGIWIWAVPMESYVRTAAGDIVCQTGVDHTPHAGSTKGKCLVTGNASSSALGINTADVDNGKTTVLTPAFDLTGYANPVIEYYRWYGNDMGDNPKEDLWQVQVRDSSTAFWKNVDQTYQSDYNWRKRIFALKEYMTSKSNIQLKFVAQDPVESGLYRYGQSTVEAAVDDFFIYDISSPSGVSTQIPLKANIYPNPADNKIEIALSSATDGAISIYDLSGKQLNNVSISGSTHYELDTHSLAP
ncbi:MAG: T9SS type A sorting domain-containing protein, partial [Flavipsychrobacter sp.]